LRGFRKKFESPFFVGPNAGSGPGQAPESAIFKNRWIPGTPVFTGVMTFYEIIKVDHPLRFKPP